MKATQGLVVVILLAGVAAWFFLVGPGAGSEVAQRIEGELGKAGVVATATPTPTHTPLPTPTPTTRVLAEFRKDVSAGTGVRASLGLLRSGERIFGAVEAVSRDISVYLVSQVDYDLYTAGEAFKSIYRAEKIEEATLNVAIGEDGYYFLVLDKQYALLLGSDVSVRLEVETPWWVGQ